MPDSVWFALFMALLLLGACSDNPATGPADMKWDRQACERCRMVLSDRHYAAQVRVFPEGSRSRVLYFDDIGCASLWLTDKPWEQDPGTEIWVKDHRTGEWIDARGASYVQNKITPMEYGLGAQKDPAPGSMDFAIARQHIARVEHRHKTRGEQLSDWLKQQAAERNTARQEGP